MYFPTTTTNSFHNQRQSFDKKYFTMTPLSDVSIGPINLNIKSQEPFTQTLNNLQNKQCVVQRSKYSTIISQKSIQPKHQLKSAKSFVKSTKKENIYGSLIQSKQLGRRSRQERSKSRQKNNSNLNLSNSVTDLPKPAVPQ